MGIFSARHRGGKTAASLCAVLILCCFSRGATEAAQPAAPGRPNYVVAHDSYRDTYILTQLFYSAFSIDDLAPMQQVVSQGMLAYPDDFRRFMALTLELLKTPDSRLFMLLAPLAPHMADSSRPADLESVIRLTGIISGRNLPDGGRLEEPSLKSRIKFYEDTSRVVRRQTDEPAPPVPGEGEAAQSGRPHSAPAYIAGDGEGFSFTRANGSTVSDWTRAGEGKQKLTSRSVHSVLPDGSVWGGVQTNFAGESETELALFMVRDGIISFTLPRGISESSFYAAEKAPPRQTEALDPEVFSRRADGAVPRPCEMRAVITPRDDAVPPELTVRLEQSNAGREFSDFICRSQCVLTYTWSENSYVLSGKYCMESGWGVWPYSDERYYQRPAAGPNKQARQTP